MNENNAHLAIAKIQDLAVAGAAVQVVNLPGELENIKRYLVPGSRELIKVRVGPPMERYRTTTLESFIAMVNHLEPDEEYGGTTACNSERIACCLDPAGEVFVSLALRYTEAYQTLRSWATPAKIAQADLLYHLKRTFKREVTPDIITDLSSVRFKAAEDQRTDSAGSRESIDSSVLRECFVGGKELVESFVVALPQVFCQIPEPEPVRVEVDLVPVFRDRCFRVRVLPDDLAKIELAILDRVAKEIAAKTEPIVYLGSLEQSWDLGE